MAVKLFRVDLPPHRMHQLVEEFEWLIAAEVAHRGLAAPIAAGTDGITTYFVREFVAADSLDVVIRDHGPAPPGDALRVATQLAEALDFAAEVSVIHGALHPRDVLVSPDEARLTDLGVSASLEKVGVTVPVRRPYTAPERIAGAAWDRRADVFGLAVLMHELLWGRRPTAFGARAADGLTDLAGADPAALRAAFTRGLALEPARRFDRASDLAAALKAAFPGLAVAGGESLAATRPSEPVRGKTADRRSTALATPRLPLDGPQKTRVRGAAPREPLAGPPESVADAPLKSAISGHEPIDLGLQSAVDVPRYAEVDEPPSVPVTVPARSMVWPAAAMLALGIALGFGGGYWVGSRPGPSTPQAAGGLEPARSDAGNAAGPAIPEPVRAKGQELETADGKAPTAGEPNARVEAASAADAKTPTRGQPGGSTGGEAPTGRLLVRSSPAGANVYIDGERQGLTPTAVRSLARGAHRVRVELQGYVAEDRSVTITAAQPSQSVTVELERPRAAASAKDRATVTPASSTTASTFTGVLVVESRPAGASVYVDGKLLGITPLVVARVDAGEHVIRLERDGYRRWSASMRVVTAERNRITASLER